MTTFREYGYQDMRGAKTKTKKQSQYVLKMLKVASKKQKEQDIIWEKNKLKQLELEGGPEEKYVTAAYAAELRESKEWTEEDARRARLDDDVTSEKDVTKSFYSNFYNGTFSGRKRKRAKEKSASAVIVTDNQRGASRDVRVTGKHDPRDTLQDGRAAAAPQREARTHP